MKILEVLFRLMKMQNSAATLENNLTVPPKVKHSVNV